LIGPTAESDGSVTSGPAVGGDPSGARGPAAGGRGVTPNVAASWGLARSESQRKIDCSVFPIASTFYVPSEVQFIDDLSGRGMNRSPGGSGGKEVLIKVQGEWAG